MGLGMPEVILILVVALIVFGPRKLPDLGKSLGQAMAQFRRASDDFKRTWEQEIELEKNRPGGDRASSSYGYNSTESNDSYNPYGSDIYGDDSTTTSNTNQLPEATTEKVVEQKIGQPETNVATAPQKKHWI